MYDSNNDCMNDIPSIRIQLSVDLLLNMIFFFTMRAKRYGNAHYRNIKHEYIKYCATI